MKTDTNKILEIKVTLMGSKPPIWRRIQIEEDTSLLELNDIIQIVMGWNGSHLWHFSANGKEYTDPIYFDEEYMSLHEQIDAGDVDVADVIKSPKSKMRYVYDYGDDWEHEIVLEKILDRDESITYPRCVKGKLASPPDDCGGLYGYYHMLEVLEDPTHEEYEDISEWLGEDWDAEMFDVEVANADLETYFISGEFVDRKDNDIDCDGPDCRSTHTRKEASNVIAFPLSKQKWFEKIVDAYEMAKETVPTLNGISQMPFKEEKIYQLAPILYLQNETDLMESEEIDKILDITLTEFLLTRELSPKGERLENSKELSFCFCFMAVPLYLKEIDDGTFDEIMDYCEEHIAELT